MQIHLDTLGCRLNEAETESWARQFVARGHTLAATPAEADLVVVNTCAVTGEAVRKSRQMVRRAQRRNPRAKLVMSGCCASLDDAAAATDGIADLVVPNPDKDRLVDLALQGIDDAMMPVLATRPDGAALFARGRNRAFVKVQDGCRHRCTYCIVTVARGEERSRPVDAIVREIRALHEQGVQEAVLTGVHLGGYRGDNGEDLRALADAVLARTSIPRLRLGSLEPWDLPDGFFTLFENQRMMPHLHLPLQSGCDSVLKRMARRCRTGEFERLLETAREACPDLQVSTDIIAGFPGETEQEWRAGLAFIRRQRFSGIHIFGFSARAGTAAAGMRNPVPAAVRRQRARQLREIADAGTRRALEGRIGRTEPVLWESAVPDADGWFRHRGYTPGFLRVETRWRENLGNRILPTRLDGLSPGGARLSGTPVR